jgi:hypothetical protein
MTSSAYAVTQGLLIATLAMRPLYAPFVNRMLSAQGYQAQVTGLGILGAIGIVVLFLLGIIVRSFIWRQPRKPRLIGFCVILVNLGMIAIWALV